MQPVSNGKRFRVLVRKEEQDGVPYLVIWQQGELPLQGIEVCQRAARRLLGARVWDEMAPWGPAVIMNAELREV